MIFYDEPFMMYGLKQGLQKMKSVGPPKWHGRPAPVPPPCARARVAWRSLRERNGGADLHVGLIPATVPPPPHTHALCRVKYDETIGTLKQRAAKKLDIPVQQMQVCARTLDATALSVKLRLCARITMQRGAFC